MDIPRIYTIRESGHRIHNPITPDQLALLGRALHLTPGSTALDLGSGSGEMLCTWARDLGLRGTGVDLSVLFTKMARARAKELGVADQVKFEQADAAGYVVDSAEGLVDLAACVGATWIGDGVPGTVELLAKSLKPGGIMLIGEPYWRIEPPDLQTAELCEAPSLDSFLSLPGLLMQFSDLGYDVVEMVLADQNSWDRYQAAQWFTMRTWLDANPNDEMADQIRAELARFHQTHSSGDTVFLGLEVLGQDNAVPEFFMPTHNNRLSPQLRVMQEFNGRIETIHICMQDSAIGFNRCCLEVVAVRMSHCCLEVVTTRIGHDYSITLGSVSATFSSTNQRGSS